MIFVRSNTFFLIYSIVFFGVIALESDKNSSVTFQLYTNDNLLNDNNLVSLSIVIDVKNNTESTDAYISIPLSLKYVKTLDEPKPITSIPNNISTQNKDKWICNNVLDIPDDLSLTKTLVGSTDGDEEEDDEDEEEEEEDESCSSDKIIANLKDLTSTQRNKIGIKLKDDLLVPIEEDKLKLFSKEHLIKINLPKKNEIIINGKYLWNILVSHSNIDKDHYNERLNWYLIMTIDGVTEIPEYKSEKSLLSYRYLLQAIQMQKKKIIAEFGLSLEKTKSFNVNLIPNLPATLTAKDKDITINFKAPEYNYKNNGISLMIMYSEETKLCDKIEFKTSTGKIDVSCEYSKKCKGGVILSKFDKELINNTEYILNIKDINIEKGGNIEITMIENDPHDEEMEKIIGVISKPCKTLFQYSYIKYTPVIISHTLLVIPKSIKTKLYIYQNPYNTSYLYGILDLPKLDIDGDYKLIIENEDKIIGSNLQFIDNISSKTVSYPKLPSNIILDSTKNKIEVNIVNNDSNKYTSVPFLFKYTKDEVKNNLKLLINSVKNNNNIIGDVEIIYNKIDNDIFQLDGPRFMDKNTIIYTFNNIKKGNYLIQLESTNNIIDKCGQLNVSHETIVKSECSGKSVKINLFLPREQKKIEFKVNIKDYKSTDNLIFTFSSDVKKYITYDINLQELFENEQLDDTICTNSHKSTIIDSTMMSSFKMLKCATPWIPSEYHKNIPNLYLLDDNNKLIKGDNHIFRYNTDPLSIDILPTLMPVTLYILANPSDIKTPNKLCKQFKCIVNKLKDDINDQIMQIYTENDAKDKGEIAIVIITTDNKIINKIKELSKPDNQTKHLFIPLFLINSKTTNSVSFQYNSSSPNYLDPKRISPLYQNDPRQSNNVLSTQIGDNILHFGVTYSESFDTAMLSMEELMYNTILPTWINYLSCINTSTVNIHYMDKKLFSVKGKYNKKYCDNLSLLYNVQIETQAQ